MYISVYSDTTNARMTNTTMTLSNVTAINNTVTKGGWLLLHCIVSRKRSFGGMGVVQVGVVAGWLGSGAA
jgi:hypothetical protein